MIKNDIPESGNNKTPTERIVPSKGTSINITQVNDVNNGVISDSIGTGKHAKTNIIWSIISSVLIIFSCICVCLFVLVIYRYNISDLTNSIKDVWSVFTPIITLGLGYLFGKKNNTNVKEKR